MPQLIQKPPGSVTIRIKAGTEWRGVKYFEPKVFKLSDNYAKHVVETLGIAEYVPVDEHGNFGE